MNDLTKYILTPFTWLVERLTSFFFFFIKYIRAKAVQLLLPGVTAFIKLIYALNTLTAQALNSAVNVSGSNAWFVNQFAFPSLKWNDIHTMPG
jgi:hypothetical protein